MVDQGLLEYRKMMDAPDEDIPSDSPSGAGSVLLKYKGSKPEIKY